MLVTPDGGPIGQLAPFPVATPWWPDVEPIVAGARDRLGTDVTVLRVLEVPPLLSAGGHVTYLAEVERPLPAEPWAFEPWSGRLDERWSGRLDEHPLRQTWARPGGPAADLAWASSVLADQGLTHSGPAEQIKSWNLSSLWRVPTSEGRAWLKVVPPFFSHEGPLVARLADDAADVVPRLLAHQGARSLLADIPGEDQFEAEEPLLLRMVTSLVDLQARWIDRLDELLELGLPDWRGPALAEAIASIVQRTAPELDEAQRRALDRFVRGLPDRFASVDACGLPDTLVHGDFHPGNLRTDGRSLVLLDWGDSGIGHPLLDRAAFLDRIPEDAQAPVRDHWDQAWREAVSGCDPERAAGLLAPVAAARQAVIYQRFLDRIEPSEHPYHQDDPPAWLRRTASLLSEEGDRPLD